MSEPLKLTCRCGWTGEFDDAQIGLTLDCPDCGRDMPITRDETAFKNRNLGDLDLSFQDSEFAEAQAEPSQPSRPVRPTAKKPRRGAKEAVVQKGATGRGKQAQSPAWVKQSGFTHATRSERKKRRNLRKNDTNAPMVIGIIVFAIVGAVGFAIYKNMDSSDRELTAGALADQIVNSVAKGAVSAQGKHFADQEIFYAFQAEVRKMFEKGLVKKNRRVTERFTGDRFVADYVLDLDSKDEWDIRITLSWNKDYDAWRITDQRVRETPAVLRGTNR